MYQGVSHIFYSGSADVPAPSEAHNIDFEGEFGIIVDDVPMGTTAEQAAAHIKLVVLINDWSLRGFAGRESAIGFGWVQAKPPCSVAPAAQGYDMTWSFPEHVAHAAHTRSLCAGTIIGGGTVSNANYREVGSSCIAERRGIEALDEGQPRTGFMRFGERVRMEATLPDGASLFGVIDQKVVQG